ncbi:MAG: ABC transporter permease [Alphaproteobacteria bacterium]|nr:ABC transporter permease [Alphaproteobacteria bacterium]
MLALLRSVALFVATLGGAALFLGVLLSAAPGDAADLVADDPALREALVERWGLDNPPWVHAGRLLTGAVQGDMGESLTYRPGQPVAELVRRGAAESAPLVLVALFTTLLVGVGLAYVGAGRVASRRVVQAASAAPVFLIAWLLMVVLNESVFALLEAGAIQRPSWFALPDEDSAFKTALAIGVLAVGSSALAEVHAACEAELARIRSAPYVDAARARGAPLWPHVLLNLVPPLTGVAASRAAFFVAGLVIIETVLHLNGAGAMLWQACRLRDYPLALGLTLAAAAAVAGAQLLGDAVRAAVDPRLRGIR